MDGSPFSFSPQQADAANAVMAWLNTPKKDRKQVFRLFGYAGTGKTTIARHIAAQSVGLVVYAAFTGKAALQMRKSGCADASTIHSLIYTVKEEKDGTITFVLNEESEASFASLIVIDECSMVGAEMAHDLLSFGRPILVLGDPAQLPPVKDAGYFTEAEPDILLTEIHRQAEGNPIIQLATIVREGGTLDLGQYGESRVVPRGTLSPEEVMAADQIICGRNTSRQGFNARFRRMLNRSSAAPEKGDRLVCLRNDKSHGLFNGGIWTIDKVLHRRSQPKNFRLKIVSDDEPNRKPLTVQVRREFFLGGLESLDWKDLKNTTHFDYGYALTAHKAQGSQWPSVIVYDESGIFREDARRWLYTAITRASERITIVQ